MAYTYIFRDIFNILRGPHKGDLEIEESYSDLSFNPDVK